MQWFILCKEKTLKYLGNVEVAELFELDQGVKGLFNILQEKITHNWQQQRKSLTIGNKERKSLTMSNKERKTSCHLDVV